MKISIIIPVHNGANTLRRCVESFTAQRYPELELVLIENNSSDTTWEVCRALERQYRGVVCLQTTRVGVSSARNMGLKHATGQIIGFADADDAVSRDTLELVSRAFARHPECDAVVTGLEKRHPDGRASAYGVSRARRWPFRKLIHHVLYDRAVSGYLVNKFWRREVLEGITFRTDLSHSEDTHYVVNALLSRPEGKAYVLPDRTYFYYQQPGSATAQLSKMFDEAGRLRLIVAARAMLADFELGWYDRLLTKRLIFSMASSQYLRFRDQLDTQQAESLKAEMRHNALYYLAAFYTAPLETLKRLMRLLGV